MSGRTNSKSTLRSKGRNRGNEFLSSLPEILQKKNARLIEKLTILMNTDADFKKKYYEIVINKYLMVLEKID